MRRFLLLAALFGCIAAHAQPGTPNNNAIGDEGRAPYRTQFISSDIRREADKADPAGTKYYRPLQFKLNPAARFTLFEARTEIPALWLDRDIYIRDEGRTGRYRLKVNGHEAGVNSDSYGTNDYRVTPYLREGTNIFSLEFTSDVPGAEMEDFSIDEARSVIENLYIWSQPKIHVFDYTAEGYPHPEGLDGELAIDMVIVNGYNMPETVNVGYDIYDPAGHLKEYNFRDVTIPGRGCDTIRFRDKIIGYEKYMYSAENPKLYRVMLSIKYNGRPIEYIPLRVGFGSTGFDGENITRNGKPVTIAAVEGDFPDRAATPDKLRKLKRGGINTVCLTRPQQKWFYDLCEEEGIYIIDCAAVDCDPRGGDRGPGGTVANDPAYLPRFIDRQQNMYRRNRNRANVIGWSIGDDSGNGYNMYKSYQWLKEADPARAVVYRYADGEWNSDLDIEMKDER